VDPVLSAMALGVVLGVQHATDPDHLVAVATIVTRQRRFLEGARVGMLWGIGHGATLTAAGSLVIGSGVTVGPVIRTGLELLVAVMLVALGLWRLRDVTRGVETVAPDHLTARHRHGDVEALHSHPHAHGDDAHWHPHLHPSRRLLAVFARDRRRLVPRAIAVGAVHGMAGSAAIGLVVVTTLETAWSAAVYLLVFGLGTIAGMTACTAAMAYPVSVAMRFTRAQRLLAAGASLGSIAFGLVYAWRVVI
jgi:high-affinity nickel-transport protein